MKVLKGLLGAALLLCAVLCMTNVPALADDGTHTHPICGAAHTDIGNHKGECADVVWTAWDGAADIDYGDSNTAYVYLTDEVTRTEALKVIDGKTLYLCLNGYSITRTTNSENAFDAVICIYGGAQFILCDCNGGGTITHSESARGRGVRVGTSDSKGTFTMYGGEISGNRAGSPTVKEDGAGVDLQQSTFTMYGGKITQNRILFGLNNSGAGVYAHSSSTFTMYGGEISYNISTESGGGVQVTGGSLNLYGGEISNNVATERGGGIWTNMSFTVSDGVSIINNTAAKGGGVFLYDYSSPTLIISGSGTIAGNTAGTGGGIYMEETSNLIINGGSITDNTVQNGNGGGIYMGGTSKLTITGGNITDNIMDDVEGNGEGNGGGIYFSGKTFQISGGANISGNQKSGEANNIYLPNGKTISVTSKLTNDVPIGVTTETLPSSSSYVSIASGRTVYALPDKFQYENDDTPIIAIPNSSGTTATLVVCIHNWGTEWKTDNTNHWHQCFICNGTDDLETHFGGTATCTEKAICAVCDMPYGNTLGHDFTDDAWHCDADQHWKKCSRCDATSEESEHVWDSGEVTAQRTCTTAGQKTYTCAVCSATKIDPLDALGHDFVPHEGKAATCTEQGFNAYDTCSRCDYTSYTEIDALGHDEISHEGKAATCTEGGWNAYVTCSRCDYTTYETLAALGHDEVSRKGKAATCTVNGWKPYVACSRCDYSTYEEITAPGHNMVSRSGQNPTCTEDGWMPYTACSRCGYYSAYETINALGHDPIHHEGKAATCTEKGFNAYDTCSRCDYTSYTEIDALGHEEVSHEGKAATCTEDGWKPYVTCSRCGYSTYEKIVALGHEEVSHEGKATTCTEDGWNAYVTCSRCDYTTYSKIAAFGHNFTGGTWQSDANRHWKKCSRCEAVSEQAQHTGGTATCKDSAVCTVCATSYGALNPEHHAGGTEIRDMVEVTAEKAGHTGNSYCKGCNTKLSDGTSIPAIFHLSTDRKSDLATAVEAMETFLNGQGSAYTEEQKKQLMDSINAIKSALKSIENAEEAMKKADAMPAADKTQPDDKAAIDAYEAARKAYDALSADEREMAGEHTKAALEAMLKSLTAYDVTYGNGSIWTENDNDNGLTFTVNGYHKKFAGIAINGATVDTKHYEIESGSTIVTLKAEYLQTLPAGKYTLCVKYTDGSTDGEDTFTITKTEPTAPPADPTAAPSQPTDASSPKTGGHGSLVLWISISVVCAGILIFLLLFFKKRKKEKEESV